MQLGGYFASYFRSRNRGPQRRSASAPSWDDRLDHRSSSSVSAVDIMVIILTMITVILILSIVIVISYIMYYLIEVRECSETTTERARDDAHTHADGRQCSACMTNTTS